MLETHVNTCAPPSIKQVRKCSHEDCQNKHHGKGLCQKHFDIQYAEMRKNRRRSNSQTAEFKAKNKIKKRSPRVRYNNAKSAARGRGLTFELPYSFWWSFISHGCIYCSEDLTNGTGISLDRVDNSKGYIYGNVVPCCKKCNSFRMDHVSYPEFCVMMQALIDYRRENNVTR